LTRTAIETHSTREATALAVRTSLYYLLATQLQLLLSAVFVLAVHEMVIRKLLMLTELQPHAIGLTCNVLEMFRHSAFVSAKSIKPTDEERFFMYRRASFSASVIFLPL